MQHLVGGIVALARAHALLTYGLALLLAGSEAFPIIGAAIPGTATIVALGALVPSGALQFWPLVIATTAGAIVGDGLSYWLGHHYRATVATFWPLNRHPELMGQGSAFFARHGGKAIIIARFTPGVRAMVPLVAGVTGMPVARFYGVNVVSAVLWAPPHVLMGVVVGASLTVLDAIAGRLVALLLLISSLLVIAVWLTLRAVRWLSQAIIRLLDPVGRWANDRDTWLRRQILSLLDPERTEVRGLMVLGALLVAALWLFLGILEDVLSGEPLVRADRAVFHLLQSLRVVPFDRIVVAITELGDAPVTVAVALTVLAWLAWHRAWHAVIYFAAAVAGGAVFALLLKVTLQQPRPDPLYASWNAFSFPSSHTTISVVLYGYLGLLIGREVAMRWRVAAVLTVVLLISAIAFSRLYLGALWLSDVAAGFAFGVAWIALLGIAYLQHAPRSVHAAGMAALAGVALAIAGVTHIALAHDADMERYAVNQPIRVMPMAKWQHGGWTELPVRRVDLLGEYEEPFTMQWAGPLADLRAALSAAGWAAPASWTLRSFLEWLSPQASPGSLPVLPRLDRGHSEGLVMIRTAGSLSEDQRLVLRVWRSDVILSVGAKSSPLWIGTVVVERINHVMRLVTVAREELDLNTPLGNVHNALPSAMVERRPATIVDPRWNGFVLLGHP